MPTKHMGTIDSDAAINSYQRQYDDMPRKYRIEDNRIPLFRRLRKWAVEWVKALRSIW